jgi:hypothetical protein
VIGRRLVQSQRRNLSLAAGLLLTRERFQDVAGTDTNLEGAVLTRYDRFRHRRPKIDVSVSFTLLPSITSSGRVRGELQSSFFVEVVKNYYVGLDVFDSLDSKPPNGQLAKNDYGISTSFRWTF